MHTLKRTVAWPGAVVLATALFLVGGTFLQAQDAAKPAADSTPSDSTDQTTKPAADDTVVLSPFVVAADEDQGYQANSTLAGTRVRTELKDIPSAISVVTSQFLKDTGATNTQDLLVYTTNTEVGGVHGNFSGSGGSTTYNESANLLRPSSNTRVRGLDAADNTRDYFLTEIPWDSYNVGRIDLQRGPNSILFGVGSPAGIINASVNDAAYKDSNQVELRAASHGSFRASGDFNYVVKKDELAFRVAALDDNTKYQQKPAFNHDRRFYAALRYDPQLFKNGHTTIRAKYENGRVRANRPRSLPPIDGITPWFQTGTSNGFANLNKLTLDPNTTWNQYGNNTAYPNYTYPWFREAFMGRMLNNDMGLYYDAGSSTPQRIQNPTTGTPLGLDSTGTIDGTISGIEFARPWAISTFNNYAKGAIPGGQYYSNVSLTDPSIFDFYNKLIDGDNKREWQNWKAANVALSQTFFDDRIGFEFVYDSQKYNDGQYAFLGGDQYIIGVDINTKLLDGSDNPNLGRPYVGNSGQYGNQSNKIERESYRFTLTGELRGEDLFGKQSFLARLFGRHVFTGLLSQDTKKTDYRQFVRWATDPGYTDALGIGADNAITDITNGARQVDWLAYLGPSLLNASTASGANLGNVSGTINPRGSQTLRFFDSHWNATGVDTAAPYTYYTHDSSGNLVTNTGTQADNPANYVGWTSGSFRVLNADNPNDLGSLYTSGAKGRNRIKSKGFVWQAYLWDGDIVPVFGWRRDEIDDINNQAAKGNYNEALMNYTFDNGGTGSSVHTVAGESKSYGVVVHTPRWLADKMPGGTNLSFFYNRSSNFKADAPRGDIFGNTIPNPDGHTKDYGVVLSTLHDRLSMKVNWYETKVSNASLQADSAGFSSSLYYVWALPYWGATHALAALDGVANPQRNQGSWGWPWNGIALDANGNPDNARIHQIAAAFFQNYPLDQHFSDEYGLGLDVAKMHSANEADWYAAVPGYQGAANLGLQPAYGGNLKSFGTGPVASVDTESKGVEFELNARPTDNWNLTLNASKTMATRTDVSPTIDSWIQLYTKFLDTDAGLLRLWGGDTFRTTWATQVLGPYQVLKNQQGSSAPEVPKWRFNMVTTYSFDRGPVKGLYIGGAYRWEDRRILGYKYSPTLGTLDIGQPWYGPTDDHFDFWAGYTFHFLKKYDWRIQLNLRNVGEDAHLVPVTIQPDGNVALSRIDEGMTWQITNVFSF
jgi:outer membrane receptor protein involved in Fe transport